MVEFRIKLLYSMVNILLGSSRVSTCYFVFSPPFGLCVYPSSLPGLFKAYLPMPAAPPPPVLRPPLLSTSGRVGEARQKSHSGCAVIASVYHQPEDFYYCRWMMGLASCRPGRAGSFQSGLKCTPHCTEASGRGTTNPMGGFGKSALK